MKQIFTQSEILSLMLYQGADFTSEDLSYKSGVEAFYQTENAYEGINMLLFPGTDNEQARLIKESRKVDPVLLDYIDELLQVYDDLYMAMCKYTYNCKEGAALQIHTWRYDREQSLQVLKTGETGSFFSTSVQKKTSDFFKQKKGLLILEIEAFPEIVHLSVNEILGTKSKYPTENEVLFPPYSSVALEQLDLTTEEQAYEDQDKKPPVGKYKVCISNNPEFYYSAEEIEALRKEKTSLLSAIKDAQLLENAKSVWASYNSQSEPDADLEENYIQWKKALQTYVRIRQTEIYQEILGETDRVNWRRKTLLEECIKAAGADANRKREEYEAKLIKQNIALAVIQGIAAFFIALSLLELDLSEFSLSDAFKIIGVAFTLIAFTLYRIFNGLALSGKLRQRTLTYLKLDELNRDIQFTREWTDEKVDDFIERYKQIIREDNQKCIENTDQLLKLLDELAKNDPGKMAGDVDI